MTSVSIDSQRSVDDGRADRDRTLRRVLLRDVADAAGVSLGTASDALNGRGRVAAATRARVQAAAHSIGYRPNALARALRVGHSRLVGLAVRPLKDHPMTLAGHPYFAPLIAGCVAAAIARGYALVVLPGDIDMAALRDLPLEAVLIADSDIDDPFVDAAFALGIPVLTDERPHDPRAQMTLDIDVDSAMAAILDHLWACGSRRPAVLGDVAEYGYIIRMGDRYDAWCAAHAVEPMIASIPTDTPTRRAAIRSLIADGCDALVGLDDADGWLMLDEVETIGLHVPDDVRIVVAAHEPRYATARIPITTLELHPHELGTRGVDLILDAIEGRLADGPLHLYEPFTLVPRASTIG